MTCSRICRELQNLLPVGKGLVKEDCDRGAAHASDSDRATKFRGDRGVQVRGFRIQAQQGIWFVKRIKTIGGRGETSQIGKSIKVLKKTDHHP